MKLFLLNNVKMPTNVILTFMSGKNSILGLSETKNHKKAEFLDTLYTYEHSKFHAQLS